MSTDFNRIFSRYVINGKEYEVPSDTYPELKSEFSSGISLQGGSQIISEEKAFWNLVEAKRRKAKLLSSLSQTEAFWEAVCLDLLQIKKGPESQD